MFNWWLNRENCSLFTENMWHTYVTQEGLLQELGKIKKKYWIKKYRSIYIEWISSTSC